MTTSAGRFAASAAGRAFPGNQTSIPWRGCGPYFAFSTSGARMVFAGWLTGFFSHERQLDVNTYSSAGCRPNTRAIARRRRSPRRLSGNSQHPSVYSFHALM